MSSVNRSMFIVQELYLIFQTRQPLSIRFWEVDDIENVCTWKEHRVGLGGEELERDSGTRKLGGGSAQPQVVPQTRSQCTFWGFSETERLIETDLHGIRFDIAYFGNDGTGRDIRFRLSSESQIKYSAVKEGYSRSLVRECSC